MKSLKISVLVAIALLLTAAAVVLAINTYTLYFPHEAVVVPPSPQVKVYVDGQAYANGTKISWNPVEPGKSYSKSLTVENTGNVRVKVTLIVEGLPAGWSLTWAVNGSVLDVGGKCTGSLTLTIPSSASGPYEWNWIKAEKVD
jgi:hypothetical protein